MANGKQKHRRKRPRQKDRMYMAERKNGEKIKRGHNRQKTQSLLRDKEARDNIVFLDKHFRTGWE